MSGKGDGRAGVGRLGAAGAQDDPPEAGAWVLWTGGQGVSLPAPSVRSGRASRELQVRRDKVAGQI